MKNEPSKQDFVTILQGAGHRATPGRVLLLRTLSEETKPLSVADLQHKLKGALDKVTLYRGLESFVEAGIARQADFRDGSVRYEFALLRPHHHHIVCTACGVTEDADCDMSPLTKKVARKSATFRTITDHSTEFFGLCNACAK